MSKSPNTKTIFDDSSLGHGQTRTGLSTQIVVMVNGKPVGAIQSFGQTQQRQTRPISEVGTDGIIEIVPSSSTTISLSIQRIVFDGLSLPEAFSRGFNNIAAQRIPFDIVVIDRFSSSADTEAITTVYRNCWFTNLAKTFSASDYIISETASVSCEQVYTKIGTTNVATKGNGHGIAAGVNDPEINTIEQAVDVGKTPGSMANRNIVNSTFT
tara:strand:+ start:310 stop:945 length:636 start_codon:yes stop_codon:yes gene_type:complete